MATMQPSRQAAASHNNGDDDDSHTTLSRQDDQDEIESLDSSVDLLASPSPPRPAAAAAAPSPAASSEQSVISPSTQTLNVLSQHDATGGGNLRYDMNNLNQDVSAMTATQQQVAVSEQDKFRNWNWITLDVPQDGELKVTIQRVNLLNPSRSYTRIKKVRKDSPAHFLPGDLVAESYEVVSKWGDGPRPKTVDVLREPSKDQSRLTEASPTTETLAAASSSSTSAKSTAARSFSAPRKPSGQAKTLAAASTLAPKVLTTDRPAANDAAANTANAQGFDTTNTEADQRAALLLAHKLSPALLPPQAGGAASTIVAHDKPASSSPTHQGKPTPLSTHQDELVPFCKACQKADTSRPHHPLCPKHPHFDNSGALEKLELIRRGIDMGCEACKYHYQHGREAKSGITHVNNCPRLTRPLRQHGEVVCVNEKGTSAPTAEKIQGASAKPAQQKEPNVQKSKSTKKGAPRSKRGTASKNDSSSSGPAQKAATSKKKAGNGTAREKAGVTKKRGTAAKKATGRKGSSRGQVSKSVTIAGSNPDTKDAVGNGLRQSTQETVGSTIASSVRRRTRKKPRYDYESDSDIEDDTNAKENARPSSQRPQSKRSKFTEKGSPVPLVVDTAAKKKRAVTLAPKTPKTKAAQVSNRNVDIQVKPNWVPCENPWGPSGYQEGDVVLVTPSGGFTHHETIYGGARFTVSPFGSNSNYDNTHRVPSEGFDVILLTRDPNAEHPWGFTYRRHEFGGACLVASVDPLSPAASAVYRGNESEQTSRASLRIHDMILSMNGKSIGGMTELGVSIELDVCGRELELVVSRYRDSAGAARQLVALERSEWTSFDDAVNDKRRLDWFEMNGPGALTSPSINLVEENDFSPFDFRGSNHGQLEFGALASPQYGHSVEAQNNFPSQGSQQFSLSQLSFATPNSLASRRSGRLPQTSRGKSPHSKDSRVYDDDDEAWLGCVCGEIHPETVRVYWIQCDDCRSWYNVAPVCVGFTELEASSVGTWVCRGCGDSVVSDQASVSAMRPVKQVSVPRGNFGKRLSAVPRSSPLDRGGNLFTTPEPKRPKRKSPVPTTAEILEDRKRRKTEDGNFLPLKSPRKKEDGTYARPCGRAPPGMMWDANRGVYTTPAKSKGAKKSVPPKKVDDPIPPSEDKSSCESPVNTQVVLPADPSTNDRRTEDGCFVPLKAPKKKEDGRYARPCGRAPPGMVWDATRGVFAPKSKATVMRKSASPKQVDAPSPLVEDKSSCESPINTQVVLPADPSTNDRRTEDGCFLPLKKPKKKEDGTYARPCGRAPPGMVWDAARGVFAPKSKATATRKSAPPKTSESSSQALTTPTVNGKQAQPLSGGNKPPKNAEDHPPREPRRSHTPSALSTTITSTNGNQAQPLSVGKKAAKAKRGSREEREADREKRTTDDGCFVPKPSALKKKEDGTYARPRGRCPPGMVWDAHRGVFAPPKLLKTKSKPTFASPKEPETTTTKPAIDAGGIKLVVTGTGITGVVTPEEEPTLLPVGSLVNVAERVWIGMNKTGGIGHVIDYKHGEDGAVLYDVKYSLGGKETGIPSLFVSPHDFSARGSVMRDIQK